MSWSSEPGLYRHLRFASRLFYSLEDQPPPPPHTQCILFVPGNFTAGDSPRGNFTVEFSRRVEISLHVNTQINWKKQRFVSILMTIKWTGMEWFSAFNGCFVFFYCVKIWLKCYFWSLENDTGLLHHIDWTSSEHSGRRYMIICSLYS